MNIAVITGRIPFEIKQYGSDDNPVVMFMTSVQRSYKKEGDEFYPEDLINCKAFGHTAKFIRDYFAENDAIELIGEIRKDDNYEKDGQTVYGQLYFHVNQAKFPVRGKNDYNGGNNKSNNNGGGAKKQSSPSNNNSNFVDPFNNVKF